jgi:hypothetical protein
MSQRPRDGLSEFGSPGERPARRRAAESRRTVRAATTHKTIVYLYGPDAGSGDPLVGKACDVSSTGVGLTLERPLAPGQLFLMHTGNRPGPTGRTLYSVVHCRPDGEHFRIGAEVVAVLLQPGAGPLQGHAIPIPTPGPRRRASA